MGSMNLKYYEDTDSLYIDLSAKPSAESREVSEGIVLDYDSEGNLVGIDIDNASQQETGSGGDQSDESSSPPSEIVRVDGGDGSRATR